MTRKRFIAGAKCPKCGNTDCVMYFQENNIGHIECADCGHKEAETNQQVDEAKRTNENVIGVFKP